MCVMARFDEHVVTEAMNRWGHVDVLVNNAGTQIGTPAVDFAEADWDRVLDVYRPLRPLMPFHALSPPGSSRRAKGFWAIKLTASPGPKGASFCRSKSEILRPRGASEAMSEEMAKVLLLACCSSRDHEAARSWPC
jgi:NAD(P)-dependent dehydrogenase (short-subunit alcohol dehydrogenase family)